MPRHELVDAALRPAVDEAGQQVGEVDLRIDAVQLARLDQRCEVGPAAPAIIAGGKKCVLSAQDHGSDGALDGVRIYLRAAVVEEPLQAIAVVQRVADRFCGRAAARQSCQLLLEPGEQVGHQRPASRLPGGAALVGWLCRGPCPRRRRARRCACSASAAIGAVLLLGQVVEFAPHMAPAVDERRALAAVRRGQALVDGVAVALQQAGVATQQRLGVLGAAAGGVVEHHRRRLTAAPGPVIAGDRPGKALLGPAPARVEHRHAGLVGEQPHRGEQDLAQPRHHRAGPRRRPRPPSRPAPRGRSRCPAAPGPAPGGTAACGRRSAPPRHGRPPPRSACRPRSGEPGRAPARPRPGRRGRRTSAAWSTRARNCTGITSSRSAVSQPISTIAPWQQGQAVLSGRAPARRAAGAPAAGRAWPGGGRCSSCAARWSRLLRLGLGRRRARPRPPRRRTAAGPRAAAPSAARTACAAASAAGAAAARSAPQRIALGGQAVAFSRDAIALGHVTLSRSAQAASSSARSACGIIRQVWRWHCRSRASANNSTPRHGRRGNPSLALAAATNRSREQRRELDRRQTHARCHR